MPILKCKKCGGQVAWMREYPIHDTFVEQPPDGCVAKADKLYHDGLPVMAEI